MRNLFKIIRKRIKAIAWGQLFCIHDWEYNMDVINGDKYSLVIAWKQWKKCGHSKLTMILKAKRIS